ncbi:MAG: signal peptide peptidase SppA [Treponema sp.]|jgi:protease-4|nr:signal peptide peptidase SppA [Treponema sp.]
MAACTRTDGAGGRSFKSGGGTGRYLELCLNNTRIARGRLQRLYAPSLLDTIKVIQKAGDDKRLAGIIVNTAGLQADRVFLWEIREALRAFRERGKKVITYFNDADIDLYCLASVGDRVVMDDGGTLLLAGYAWGRGYVRQALEKLGVGARELRFFTYKSAAETFTRDSLSDADKEQYGAYLDDIFALSKETICAARGLSDEAFSDLINRGFLFGAAEARTRGLVDFAGRRDGIIAALRSLEGSSEVILNNNNDDTASPVKDDQSAAADADEPKEAAVPSVVVFGDIPSSIMTAGRKARAYPGERGGGPELAVIKAQGTTELDRGMGARAVARLIRELSEKKRVKAIVLRVDSPGGSAVAADYIAEAIRDAKRRVPVVVSMGAVAASGGYWAAMDASSIIVSPYTLTGSIGVIGTWFYDKGLDAKLGLSLGTLARGEHADLLTGMLLPSRDLSAEETERYKGYILSLYDAFVGRVAAGRSLPRETVENLAQGRVYSGSAALRIGLADGAGGLEAALQEAARLAKLSPQKKVSCREYPKPGFYEALLARAMASQEALASAPALSLDTLLLPGLPAAKAASLWEDISFRLRENGKALPLLPLGFLE